MAHFLRVKQSGLQRDFSAGLDPQLFAIDEVTRYGVNSQVSALAYDPVQSLLAIGTNDTKFGSGQIYVFGQKRVSVVFTLPRKASVKEIRFCANKLVSVDSKHEVCLFSLEGTRVITSYAPPGAISAFTTDPVLDYTLIGLQNGEVIAYDLDRQSLTPLRVPNLLAEHNPRARMLPVVTLSFHPRDIGSLLVAYPEGAAIFSFQQNKCAKKFCLAPPHGGRGMTPRLTHAVWHPTGTFILTTYEDASVVIWDVKDGRQILHRSVDGGPAGPGNKGHLSKVAWCAKENPDDTGVLFAGGRNATDPTQGLTFWDLGPTPVYATASWQILTDHFSRPKREHTLPTPPNTQVVDYCLIPRKSPHFAGASDPIAVVAILSSGEMLTLSFPSGHPISPTNQLHVSLSLVHPFVDRITMAYVDRTRWLGLVENRSRGPPLLKGGAEAKRSVMRFAHRNIIQTAHADGIVRVYDAGHGDEIENEDVLQADVARALGRFENVDVCNMSMAGATGELAVGLRTGEVVIFRWGKNKNFGRDVQHGGGHQLGLETIVDRAESNLKEGLMPLSLLDSQAGAVTALKASDVGFVCAGFESGKVYMLDLRGPAVIFEGSVADFKHSGGSKRSSHSIRSNSGSPHGHARPEHPTCIEFSVLTLDGEDYSSILAFVGTSTGRLVTLKLLPSASGGFSVNVAGSVSVDDSVVAICPLVADTGETAAASPNAVAGLRAGDKVNGVILVVTRTSARIFKPPHAKGAHKTWDNFMCHKATVARFEAHTSALVGLFGDGTVKAFSIPGLKEIASTDISRKLTVQRLSEAVLTPTGLVFGWTGPSEIAVLNIWGTGQDLTRHSLDALFNPDSLIPARPTISNMAWISGTTHVTIGDMDKLIGGPDRPMSKRMVAQMRAEEQASREASLAAGRNPQQQQQQGRPGTRGGQQEGYWAYMQRQIQERTETLGLTGDSMDRVEEQSEGWASDVNKYVRDQKKAAVKGYITSKLGI